VYAKHWLALWERRATLPAFDSSAMIFDKILSMATQRYAALLRGINVGTAKRVSMADLKALYERLGLTDVKTLLNSGNIVFTASAPITAETLEGAFQKQFGFGSRVTLLTSDELREMTSFQPPPAWAAQPSRFLVATWTSSDDHARVLPLSERTWGDEALHVHPRWAYLWCPNGSLESKCAVEIGKALGDRVTTRTWTTMQKIAAAARMEVVADNESECRAPSGS